MNLDIKKEFPSKIPQNIFHHIRHISIIIIFIILFLHHIYSSPPYQDPQHCLKKEPSSSTVSYLHTTGTRRRQSSYDGTLIPDIHIQYHTSPCVLITSLPDPHPVPSYISSTCQYMSIPCQDSPRHVRIHQTASLTTAVANHQ